MKIAIVGCTHAGTAAVLNASRLYPEAEITVYEKNDTISFLSCGIALYVGGIVKDPKELFYSSPEQLEALGVKVKMVHEVLEIDVDNKRLKVKDLKNNKEFEDNYDKLIVTVGSWPITPKIDGIELENILMSKNYYHANTIIEKYKDAKNIVVVGAGYIGIELVEAFEMVGKNVTLIDTMDRVLSKYLDKEYTDLVEKSLVEHNIKLALDQSVTRFEGKDGKVSKVITTKGEYDADIVIQCIGFRPNTDLLRGKVDMLNNGAIIVDQYMRTSHQDVFAAGDCCAVRYNPTEKHNYIPLATNAVRMGTLAARNLEKTRTEYLGTQGTSGIKIYEYNIAATGLTEAGARDAGFEAEVISITDNYRPEFMPTYDSAILKLVYEKNSKRLMGAQILSKADLTQMMNTVSVCIQNKMTIDQLAFLDFFFQPHYNKPWNLLNLAALKVD